MYNLLVVLICCRMLDVPISEYPTWYIFCCEQFGTVFIEANHWALDCSKTSVTILERNTDSRNPTQKMDQALSSATQILIGQVTWTTENQRLDIIMFLLKWWTYLMEKSKTKVFCTFYCWSRIHCHGKCSTGVSLAQTTHGRTRQFLWRNTDFIVRRQSVSSIAVSKNPQFHGRAKHIHSWKS